MPDVKNPEDEAEVTKAQKTQQRNLAKLQKAYNDAYSKAAADKEEEERQVAESYFGAFHVREKRMMKEERALMEGGGRDGGSQWEISRAGMNNLPDLADVEYYGMLDLSNENIKAVSEIYIEKLKGDMMDLLQTTKSFTENIGKYFSADRRSTAMSANKKAQAEGEEVVELLKKTPAKASEGI